MIGHGPVQAKLGSWMLFHNHHASLTLYIGFFVLLLNHRSLLQHIFNVFFCPQSVSCSLQCDLFHSQNCLLGAEQTLIKALHIP